MTSVASVCLLLQTVFGSLFTSSDMKRATAQTAAVLTPLVPGVNIPWSHVTYIFFGYGVSTLIHELGHAFALATVGRRIDQIGWFIMCGLPGAYIKCRAGAIQSLRPGKQLHVFFAGVWHNVLLAACICFVLYAWQLVPFMSGLLFSSGDGVTVLSVLAPFQSHGGGVGRIDVGTLIVSVSGRPTLSVSDYENALTDIFHETISNASQPIAIRYAYGGSSRKDHSALLRTDMWDSGPEAMYEAITVVDSRPGALLRPVCAMWLAGCLRLPHAVLLAMYYTASISGGLALVNSLPVYWLDGDDALGACLCLFLPDRDPANRATIKSATLRLGTGLLVLSLVMSFVSLV